MKHIIFLLLSITLVFTSCEKIVENVDLPEQDPRLVVTCFLSPDDSIIVAHVFLSSPIFNNFDIEPYNPVSNAIVKITDFTSEAQFTFDGDKYILSTALFPILPGNNYRLNVSASGFEPVEAFCKVPSNLNQSLELLSIDSTKTDQYNTEYKFKLAFTDFQGIGDFYRLGGSLKVVFLDTINNYSDTSYYGLFLKYGMEYMSDKDNDGERIFSELLYWKYNYEDESYGSENIIGMRMHLLTTDEHYYRFHKTLSAYSGEDPFSEPVIVYSNINKGLGVFGAYRKYTIDISL